MRFLKFRGFYHFFFFVQNRLFRRNSYKLFDYLLQNRLFHVNSYVSLSNSYHLDGLQPNLTFEIDMRIAIFELWRIFPFLLYSNLTLKSSHERQFSEYRKFFAHLLHNRFIEAAWFHKNIFTITYNYLQLHATLPYRRTIRRRRLLSKPIIQCAHYRWRGTSRKIKSSARRRIPKKEK